MREIFSRALGIDTPWFVKEVHFDAQKKRLDLHIDFPKGTSFPMEVNGVVSAYKAYDTVQKKWRHLNFFEHECYLHTRVPRIKTPDDKIQLFLPPWSGLQSGFTLLFEAFILQLTMGMPVHHVGRLVNVSDYKIWSMLEKYTESARALQEHGAVTQIGMDETSIAKGHDYVTLFVDLKEKKTLFVAEGKSHETVKEFTEDLVQHQGKIDNITDVSCDMSPAFIKGVTTLLPEAKITFDKFHIVKIISEGVDAVRRITAKDNPALKGTRYLFLKNDKNLSEKQRSKKADLQLSKGNEKVFRALSLREAFQDLYAAKTEEDFEMLLQRWYFWATHSRLEPMKKVAKTIKNHWEGILQWKKSQINNGLLEGLNSVIQAAKRKARGYKFKHFKTIVYLITGGLAFSKVNAACLPT
jgi:transposase